MSRSKNVIEMLRLSSKMPHENIIHLDFGKKIFRYDPKKSWFTEVIVPDESDTMEREVRVVSDEGAIPVCGWTEVELSKKKRNLLQLGATKLTIPRLLNKKVKGGGRIPSLAKARALFPKNMESEEPTLPEVCVEEPVLDHIEQVVQTEPDSQKVAPRSAPRKARMTKPEPETAMEMKSLKVIRRRREQAPKVFETQTTVFPKAMLEGIELGVDEQGDTKHE